MEWVNGLRAAHQSGKAARSTVCSLRSETQLRLVACGASGRPAHLLPATWSSRAFTSAGSAASQVATRELSTHSTVTCAKACVWRRRGPAGSAGRSGASHYSLAARGNFSLPASNKTASKSTSKAAWQQPRRHAASRRYAVRAGRAPIQVAPTFQPPGTAWYALGRTV